MAHGEQAVTVKGRIGRTNRPGNAVLRHRCQLGGLGLVQGGVGHHTADDGVLPHQLAAENVPLTLAVLDEPLLCTGKAGVVIVAGPGQDGSILHHVPHGVAGHHRPYHQVTLTVGAGA